MGSYQEKEKIIARSCVLKEAVRCLTEDRDKSTVASRDYVRRVHQFIRINGTPFDQEMISFLSEETIARWEHFYDSITQKRKAENLKVAYLAGPNPDNDLQELMNVGVLPENVWAFETDSSTYEDAVWSTLNSKFPFLKLIKGNIGQFFAASPQKFDIIYLDFCGPLPSRNEKQKTLATITSILAHHAINSPGVLITNVSLPNQQQDPKGFDLITKLVASYLYPKDFLEQEESNEDNENWVEGAISGSFSFNNWLTEIQNNIDFYYGQYITRLIIDIASVVVPYNNFTQKHGLFEQFFNLKNKSELEKRINELYHVSEEGEGGDIIDEPGQMPILWTVASLHSHRNSQDLNYPQLIYQDPEYEKFGKLFLRQLSLIDNESEIINNFERLHFLLDEGFYQSEFYSKKFINLDKRRWHQEMYQFCDVVLFHQIKELLFRQIAVPYHVNIEKTKRWTYLAKDTQMFMDMIILDECRYIYDWMPTVDMIEAGMDSIDRQLCYRFALDALGKHRRWYNNEYFFGTSIIGQFEEGFEAKSLEPRIKIN
ncbi:MULTISPECIES: class I SAM-dependent methyltransferase [Dolichospermum]|uniref:class I SAM-dependent methyltransferase n=1 Tax=Dolichospermum TaxID=748770 RepID=UPI001445A006|nr:MULTISPECIES: class I SAM-dependent methyltransferase [Dolichospermum]MBO1050503.1 class I SAM-dependent methyltransferase [Dolichospermum sp. DET73]MDB9438936.1 hypothetical protein [Dolichospermum lemmermannii CS-548]MTJ19296.1 class I SAM-dependent methyltransferase [Dolichospermum sp. UHCC 0299]MTJ41332.1 class I SAM-dependent methyltransferase [Dolichospermum sp. UHCC 0406]